MEEDDEDEYLNSFPLITDYKDQYCGNCHKYLAESDKYCRYCGTKRGEGKFEPFRNIVACVYGPPVTGKHQCVDCQNIWTDGIAWPEKDIYCPECGSHNILFLGRQESFDWESSEDEYREGDVLLSEAEIDKILTLRTKASGYSEHLSHLILSKNGFAEAEKAVKNENLTEKEEAKLKLEVFIQRLKGENPQEIFDTTETVCPICESRYLAAIGWWGFDKDGNPSHTEYAKKTGKELYYNSGENKHESKELCYRCLKCNTKFNKK